jgi:CBS domain containing-hemolysin-like protein
MIDKSLIQPKEELVTVTENTTLAEVADIFATANMRAIPILDVQGKIFRGNIYKQHLFEHQANQGDLSLPVTTLMRNSTKFIFLDSQFYELFFAMRDLPFIAVLDDNHHFYGVFTHNALMDVLAQSWSVEDAGVAISVALKDNTTGELAKIAKIISRFSNISSVVSLRQTSTEAAMMLLITLPIPYDSALLDLLKERLNKKGFPVLDVENLARFNA